MKNLALSVYNQSDKKNDTDSVSFFIPHTNTTHDWHHDKGKQTVEAKLICVCLIRKEYTNFKSGDFWHSSSVSSETRSSFLSLHILPHVQNSQLIILRKTSTGRYSKKNSWILQKNLTKCKFCRFRPFKISMQNAKWVVTWLKAPCWSRKVMIWILMDMIQSVVEEKIGSQYRELSKLCKFWLFPPSIANKKNLFTWSLKWVIFMLHKILLPDLDGRNEAAKLGKKGTCFSGNAGNNWTNGILDLLRFIWNEAESRFELFEKILQIKPLSTDILNYNSIVIMTIFERENQNQLLLWEVLLIKNPNNQNF